ncbi:MAG: hypothetical protein WCJ17_03535 [bacterium]
MKKVLVSILMISTFFNLIPAADQIVVEEIKPDNKLLVTYDKLRQRLLRMPQLLKMFEQLHSPEIRGEYEKYLDHRYEFDVTLNKYELAADLKSALKRFNDSMAPQKKIAWWKRKSVMIPLALAMAATGLFAGVKLNNYRNRQLVERYKASLIEVVGEGDSVRPDIGGLNAFNALSWEQQVSRAKEAIAQAKSDEQQQLLSSDKRVSPWARIIG